MLYAAKGRATLPVHPRLTLDPTLYLGQPMLSRILIGTPSGMEVRCLPTTGIADNHLHALNASNARQIMDILEVYNKYGEVSGAIGIYFKNINPGY
jgi:hypothetical protein